ncbi:MAG: helix-turn-helix domain-containing protein [Prolixibacteraceae bacterium]
MSAQILTTEDLMEFKAEFLDEIKKLFKELAGQPVKKWLKSYEVRKILNISPGTLQNLRLNKTLPFTKIGGVIYYEYADIQKMLESNKVHGYSELAMNQKNWEPRK